MPLDPRLQALLTSLAGIEMPPFDSLDPVAMRAIYDNPMAGARQEPVAAVENLTIPAADGTELPARLYRPLAADSDALLVYFHGGGFVFGNLDTHDQSCRVLSNQLRAPVLSVGYRLAPEYPFPVPLDDCFAATLWADRHRAQLGAGTGPLLVGGDSAGGNLAAAVSLKARDSALVIAGQLLLYPVINHDFSTASYQRGDSTPMLTTGMMRRFWECYLKDAADGANPLASPLRATSLAGLPPAYVVTAEYDPLLDEGRAYAEALRTAGVTTQHRHCEGMIHGFMGIPLVEDTAREIYTEAAAFFRSH